MEEEEDIAGALLIAELFLMVSYTVFVAYLAALLPIIWPTYCCFPSWTTLLPSIKLEWKPVLLEPALG